MVVIGVGFGGYYVYKNNFAKKPTVASVQHITATAKKMNLQVNVQGTGTAYAAATKDVMPNNNGTLKDLSLKVGDTVTAGQKLFVSDSDETRQAVTTAQNSLDDANISLTSAKNQLTSDQNALATAQSKPADSQNQQGGQADKTIEQYQLAVEKSKTTVQQNQLKVNSAKDKLTAANQQANKMTVTAPIGGVITAVNNSNGDNIQQSKAVLTIVDMSSLKIKVSVDELDIAKVKQGQKAEIKFDAIKDKTFEGSVETIAQTGTTSNNVTTYDVIVAIKDPAGIKLGMNANVNILVDSKENALAIPAEALVERNGNKYVMVESTDGSASNANTNQNAQAPSESNTQAPGGNSQRQSGNGQNSNRQNGNRQNGQRTNNAQGGNAANFAGQGTPANGKLVQIKTGLENANYIEVTEGLTEGQKILITLPQTNSTTNNKNNVGGFGGFSGGGFTGGAVTKPQGGNNGR